jgi:hypothetical protein
MTSRKLPASGGVSHSARSCGPQPTGESGCGTPAHRCPWCWRPPRTPPEPTTIQPQRPRRLLPGRTSPLPKCPPQVFGPGNVRSRSPATCPGSETPIGFPVPTPPSDPLPERQLRQLGKPCPGGARKRFRAEPGGAQARPKAVSRRTRMRFRAEEGGAQARPGGGFAPNPEAPWPAPEAISRRSRRGPQARPGGDFTPKATYAPARHWPSRHPPGSRAGRCSRKDQGRPARVSRTPLHDLPGATSPRTGTARQRPGRSGRTCVPAPQMAVSAARLLA